MKTGSWIKIKINALVTDWLVYYSWLLNFGDLWFVYQKLINIQKFKTRFKQIIISINPLEFKIIQTSKPSVSNPIDNAIHLFHKISLYNFYKYSVKNV